MQTIFDQPLVVDADKCTGCGICELICVQEKNCSIAESRIKILRMEKLDVNIPVIRINCDLCGKCIELCPTTCIKFVDIKEAALSRKKNKIGTFPAPVIGVQTLM